MGQKMAARMTPLTWHNSLPEAPSLTSSETKRGAIIKDTIFPLKTSYLNASRGPVRSSEKYLELLKHFLKFPKNEITGSPDLEVFNLPILLEQPGFLCNLDHLNLIKL